MELRRYLIGLATSLTLATTQSILLLYTRRLPPSRALTWGRRLAWVSLVGALFVLASLVVLLLAYLL